MGFSKEWESAYQQSKQLSVWPWSHMISLVHHYGNLHKGMRVLELGCGAGANIPFFVKAEADYYAVEGSVTMVERLNEVFKGENVHIAQSDFTRDVHWGGTFDLIIDRSSLTHNATDDIQRAIGLIKAALKQGGKFIGMDWFSTKFEAFEKDASRKIDDYTRYFTDGYFSGLGNVHFSDEGHLRELFSEFSFEYLAEKQTQVCIPEKHISAWWDFVVMKG